MSTHKIVSTSTIHEIMQEDIDGEISSTHNSVFSQQYEENIPPDPSEEAFLRQFDEEEIVPMNLQDEIDNQASPHQQLPINVQHAESTTEIFNQDAQLDLMQYINNNSDKLVKEL